MNTPINNTISGHTASCGKVLQKSAQGRRKIGGRKKEKPVIAICPKIGCHSNVP